MTKKERVGGEVGRLIGIVLALFVFVALRANVGLAYEREIILSDEYQTEKEKERFKDITEPQEEKSGFKERFKLDISGGYGFSYATVVSGLYGLSDEYKTYLDRLDMKFAEHTVSLRLTATYILSPQIGIYLGTPAGVVLERDKGRGRSDDTNFSGGVGDVYGGIFYNVLSETKYRPNITIDFDVNSNTAKFSSMGDGLWDFTLGIQPRKFVAKSLYLFGAADYTFRLEENNINPGGIVGYGGGVGILWGKSIIEPGLKAYHIGETKLDSKTLFKDDEDLIFNIAWKSVFDRGSLNFTIGNLDEGLDFRTTTWGFEYSIPIF